MEKVLEVMNMTKLYKNNRGVKNINFEICRGDIFGFLGPNGAGKTTVMKSITGLCKPESGEIQILGYNLKNQFEKAIEKVGAIIETAEVYEYMTAYQNLKQAARFYEDVDEVRIEEVLELVQLQKYKNEKAGQFSLGMKQRLALAVALLSNPEILILDEPTNGLDIEGTVQMRNLILDLSKEKKITFFISSHLVHEIELMCNKVAIINGGILVNSGIELTEVKNKYPSLEDFFLAQVKEQRGEVV